MYGISQHHTIHRHHAIPKAYITHNDRSYIRPKVTDVTANYYLSRFPRVAVL